MTTQNMEPFETQLKKGKHIRLSETEKNAHKAAIVRAMHAHPIEARIPSPFNFNLTSLPGAWLSRPLVMRIAAVVLIIGAISSSSLAYASESALPGDALYGVKHMKEAVAVSLAPTTEARAQVQKKQIQTRLQEVKTLKQKGTFTKEKATIVKNELAENTAGLKATVATLHEEGKQDVVKNVTTELVASVADLTSATAQVEQPAEPATATLTKIADVSPSSVPETTPEVLTVGAFDFETDASAAVDAILSSSVATIDAVTDETTPEMATTTPEEKDTAQPVSIATTEPQSEQNASSVAVVPEQSATMAATVDTQSNTTPLQPKKIYSIFGKVTVGPFCVDVKPGNICEPPTDMFFGKTIAAYNIEKTGVIARSPITRDGNYSLSLPSAGTYRLRVEGFGTSFTLNGERATLTEESPIQILDVAVTLNREESL